MPLRSSAPAVASPAASAQTAAPAVQQQSVAQVQDEVRNVLTQYGRFVQHAKYGEVWHFDVAGDAFAGQGSTPGLVFRIEPAKVLAFAKEPHGHTSFRFS